jgi:hypothetical protein
VYLARAILRKSCWFLWGVWIDDVFVNELHE